MDTLGRHILVELYNCSTEAMNDAVYIEQSMVAAAKEAKATVINSTFHHFSPFGVSGVVVIQESHLAIHTWPEYNYAAIDLFTCGDAVNPWIAYEFLKKAFGAGHGSAMEIKRGQPNLLEKNAQNLAEWREEHEQRVEEHKASRNVWFTDKDENTALSLRHKGDRLYRKKSPYQLVEVYDTFAYGKMLSIDNMVMCTERDEYGYHEMITHVAMLSHKNVKRALVIGGGDGGTVRELLRHPDIEEVVMVEIDKTVVEASCLHLPSLSAAFDNPKLKLIIDDGIKYVAQAQAGSFDLIIVDSTDPEGPALGLFSYDFYANAHRILNDTGILVTQSESPRFGAAAFVDCFKCYKSIFGENNVHCYLVFIPTYPSGMWAFSYSSKGNIRPSDFDSIEAKAFSQEHNLQYYNENVHLAAFALPNFVKNMIDM
ncbi:MAG: polyamine aminopropyltransferase [Chitinophagales bacterium]